jgi:hypothetical protein
MSGINNHLAAKNYFYSAQAIREMEPNATRAQKGEKTSFHLAARVNSLSPKAKHLPAWLKPAGYTVIAIAAIAATAFIGSRMTPPQTTTPNPNPAPPQLDPSTRQITVDPKSKPDLNHHNLGLDILINLGDHYQNLDEVPDDDRLCLVIYTPYTSDGSLEGSRWRFTMRRKKIKQHLERAKDRYSEYKGRVEVKIDCDPEFTKMERARQYELYKNWDNVIPPPPSEKFF